MTLGYKIEVCNGKEKVIFIDDKIHHKIDVEMSKRVANRNKIPNWFMIWIKKDQLESYILMKKEMGFKITNYLEMI